MTGSKASKSITNIEQNDGKDRANNNGIDEYMVTVSWDISPYPVDMSFRNPNIPTDIYANEDEGVTIVKWNNGTENKVTCDSLDTFSAEVAFALAFTYKSFGGKKQFKSKWWEIISRRINWLGDVRTAEQSELARRQAVKQDKKDHDEKKKKNLKTQSIKKIIEKNKPGFFKTGKKRGKA